MIYLDTKHCGYDLDSIGFPSVETCMAVVFEANSWLVGWHASSATGMALASGAATFKDYIDKMGTRLGVRLYGVTHTSRGDIQAIQTELRKIAEVIVYQGPVTCVALPADLTVVTKDYIEYRRRGSGKPCEIYYKNSEEVNYTPGQVHPTKTRHRTVHPAHPQAQLLYGGDDEDDLIAPIVTGVTSKVGNLKLRRLSKSNWTNFNYP